MRTTAFHSLAFACLASSPLLTPGCQRESN